MTCHLLALPRELRDQIYFDAVAPDPGYLDSRLSKRPRNTIPTARDAFLDMFQPNKDAGCFRYTHTDPRACRVKSKRRYRDLLCRFKKRRDGIVAFPGLNILYTNKQISAEAVSVLYNSTTFILEDPWAFFKMIGSSNASKIRHIAVESQALGLNCEHYSGRLEWFTEDLVRTCPQLRELDVFVNMDDPEPDFDNLDEDDDEPCKPIGPGDLARHPVPSPTPSEIRTSLLNSMPNLRTTMIFVETLRNQSANEEYFPLWHANALMLHAEKAGWKIVEYGQMVSPLARNVIRQPANTLETILCFDNTIHDVSLFMDEMWAKNKAEFEAEEQKKQEARQGPIMPFVPKGPAISLPAFPPPWG